MSVNYSESSGIGKITISRPDALNALNRDTLSGLVRELKLAAKQNIRCLIITGEGDKSFVAGSDIAEISIFGPQEAKAFSDFGNRVMRLIEKFPLPVIAAVQGYALGSGFDLALACDMIVASEKASFAFPEVDLGITPGFGGMQRLVRAVGMPYAKKIIFTAHTISAQEALRIGLATAVYPDSEFPQRTSEIAAQIASGAPLALRAAKSALYQGYGRPHREACEIETEAFASCFATDDQRMAMQAFLSKQPPGSFKGE